jgi:hypothetical protein
MLRSNVTSPTAEEVKGILILNTVIIKLSVVMQNQEHGIARSDV